ncbi:MAG: N-acetylglucosamine-6-phosphate deacetylase [Acidimicrobiia bacterium]|nr:N-acetylglucosamine-6-phosphate deacetylase [Acidimicrobiia bacterium]
MTVITADEIVLADDVLRGAWIAVEDGRISGVGEGRPPRSSILFDGRIVPGFVDLHVHGGGGASVTGGDPDEAARAAAFHQARGTTRTLVSLVTAPVDDIVVALEALDDWIVDERLDDGRPGQVVGVHLEGPFLNPVRAGAQSPTSMLGSDGGAMAALTAAGGASLRMVTIAPELPGAPSLIHAALDAGLVVAAGHSDATYDEAVDAFRAGVSLVTHVCNGMRPLHHREPSLVGAALTSPAVTCELILDGVHVHSAMARLVVAAKGADHVALVTDAIAAAGCADGRWVLGSLDVEVAGGVARLVKDDLPDADNGGTAARGSLAGSTLTMDEAFKRAVTEVGVPMVDACRMASLTPARVLGIDAWAGSLEPGKDADLVLLRSDWEVAAVVARGDVVRGADVLGVEGL